MSRPPWGKVAPTGDGRGELALKFRLPHNQRTYHNHANKTALNAQGHTTPQASSPPPSPNGPTSHPKGEAKLRTAKPVQKLKAALPDMYPKFWTHNFMN